jgi:hypothetical protein
LTTHAAQNAPRSRENFNSSVLRLLIRLFKILIRFFRVLRAKPLNSFGNRLVNFEMRRSFETWNGIQSDAATAARVLCMPLEDGRMSQI